MARVSARAGITPAILVRYSRRAAPVGGRRGDRLRGGRGLLRGVGLSSAVPITDCRRLGGPQRRSATLVRPIAQVATLPPETVSTTAAAAVA